MEPDDRAVAVRVTVVRAQPEAEADRANPPAGDLVDIGLAAAATIVVRPDELGVPDEVVRSIGQYFSAW